VVPARDEEDLIGDCLRSLAAQRDLGTGELEVLVVLDACRDRTRERVLEFAAAHPRLPLRLLDGPGRGAGAARRVGMDAACDRLLEAGRTDGLIACTDADSTVDPGWVRAQLDAVKRGARAIGGRIELSARDRERLGPGVMAQRDRHALRRHALVKAAAGPHGSTVDHWQFSGASMAVTAEVYRAVGGLDPEPWLEDEAFERALLRHGVPIQRRLDVRVTTSARLEGRARRGLAHDLARAVRQETAEEGGAP
jgi:glycosyltransferase involved in cell wall biosynthesis